MGSVLKRSKSLLISSFAIILTWFATIALVDSTHSYRSTSAPPVKSEDRIPASVSSAARKQKIFSAADVVIRSHEDWLNLSEKERQLYITELREIVETLAKADVELGTEYQARYDLSFLLPEAYADSGNRACIYAGWIRQMNGRYCGRPPSAGCSRGHIQCNPLVYGMENGKAMCTAIGTSATSSCARRAKPVAQVSREIARNPSAWNSFRSGLTSYCRSPRQSQVSICRSIQTRVARVEAVVGGSRRVSVTDGGSQDEGAWIDRVSGRQPVARSGQTDPSPITVRVPPPSPPPPTLQPAPGSGVVRTPPPPAASGLGEPQMGGPPRYNCRGELIRDGVSPGPWSWNTTSDGRCLRFANGYGPAGRPLNGVYPNGCVSSSLLEPLEGGASLMTFDEAKAIMCQNTGTLNRQWLEQKRASIRSSIARYPAGSRGGDGDRRRHFTEVLNNFNKCVAEAERIRLTRGTFQENGAPVTLAWVSPTQISIRYSDGSSGDSPTPGTLPRSMSIFNLSLCQSRFTNSSGSLGGGSYGGGSGQSYEGAR